MDQCIKVDFIRSIRPCVSGLRGGCFQTVAPLAFKLFEMVVAWVKDREFWTLL